MNVIKTLNKNVIILLLNKKSIKIYITSKEDIINTVILFFVFIFPNEEKKYIDSISSTTQLKESTRI